jgi:hypothetical protein
MTEPPAPGTPADTPPGPGRPGAHDANRTHWLFRDTLGQHQIHPLMRLILAHRAAGSPPPAPG